MQDIPIEALVEQAKGGSKRVLETIVLRIQDNIYNLAVRMLFIPADAEDATQEILVKIITHLGMFRGESRFETWAYRIAANHLLTMRKSRAERWKMNFDVCLNLIEEEALISQDEFLADAEQQLMTQETKIACFHYLMLCLKRDLRLPFILSEVFGVTSTDGAEILELTPAAYRQRLSRGRKQIMDFLSKQCGLIDPQNPCRCESLAVLHVRKGHIDPRKPFFAVHPCRLQGNDDEQVTAKELDQMAKIAMLIRSHPRYAAPGVLVESMKNLIGSGRFQLLGRA